MLNCRSNGVEVSLWYCWSIGKLSSCCRYSKNAQIRLVNDRITIVGPSITDRRQNNILRTIWFHLYFRHENNKENQAKPILWKLNLLVSIFEITITFCICVVDLYSICVLFAFFFIFLSSCSKSIWLIAIYLPFGGMAGKATCMQSCKVGKRSSQEVFCPKCQ